MILYAILIDKAITIQIRFRSSSIRTARGVSLSDDFFFYTPYRLIQPSQLVKSDRLLYLSVSAKYFNVFYDRVSHHYSTAPSCNLVCLALRILFRGTNSLCVLLFEVSGVSTLVVSLNEGCKSYKEYAPICLPMR